VKHNKTSLKRLIIEYSKDSNNLKLIEEIENADTSEIRSMFKLFKGMKEFDLSKYKIELQNILGVTNEITRYI
jgi:hypothetical protein